MFDRVLNTLLTVYASDASTNSDVPFLQAWLKQPSEEDRSLPKSEREVYTKLIK